MNERELKRFEELELGFCGCGDPEGALRLLCDTLQAFADRSARKLSWEAGTRKLTKILGLDHPQYEMLGLSYLYFIDSVGLLEHGTSIYGSWLSECGEEVLEALKAVDIEAMMEEPYDYQYEDLTQACSHCNKVTKRHRKKE